jgi:hypothetical protein
LNTYRICSVFTNSSICVILNVDMSQDEFTQLFRYMSERFDKIDAALDLKADKSDIDRIYGRLDDVVAELDDIKTEQAAQRKQLDRHERWHDEVADHVGLTLSHEA